MHLIKHSGPTAMNTVRSHCTQIVTDCRNVTLGLTHLGVHASALYKFDFQMKGKFYFHLRRGQLDQ